MSELEALRALLIGIETSVHAARLTLDHLIKRVEAGEQAKKSEPDEKKVPPTFGDSETQTPGE